MMSPMVLLMLSVFLVLLGFFLVELDFGAILWLLLLLGGWSGNWLSSSWSIEWISQGACLNLVFLRGALLLRLESLGVVLGKLGGLLLGSGLLLILLGDVIGGILLVLVLS